MFSYDQLCFLKTHIIDEPKNIYVCIFINLEPSRKK